MYEHLNLKAWPFQTAADPEFATVWAGRPQTKVQIDRLLWKMQFTPKSALHLLWANFGMGKTHTLFHLQHLCRQTRGKLVSVYAVMPQRATSFLDIYRALIADMPFDFLGEQLMKIGTAGGSSLATNPLFTRSPGVVNALLALRSGDPERGTAARQWLAAQPGLAASDLRLVGVTYRIKTPEDAINVLTILTRLISYKSTSPTKLVVMLDEFQRIGESTARLTEEINNGLHTYFNQNPTGLELILSFSFGRQDNITYMLSGALRSRAEPQTINLDVMTKSEAEEFMHDLLNQFRLNKDERWAHPFTPEALRTLIKYIGETKTLTPRRLMLYANHIVVESYANDPGRTNAINTDEVHRYLADPQLGMMDTDVSTEAS